MRRLSLLSLAALALAGAACSELNPRPGPIRAMEPRPNPPSVTAAAPDPVSATQHRVRQHRWLTRFWEELTPVQRHRVERRMQRGQPPLAMTGREAELLWDTLGLEERDTLIFGNGTLPRHSRPLPSTAGEMPARTAEGG